MPSSACTVCCAAPCPAAAVLLAGTHLFLPGAVCIPADFSFTSNVWPLLPAFLCIPLLCIQPFLGAPALPRPKQLHLQEATGCETWSCTAPGDGLGVCATSPLHGEKRDWGYTHVKEQAGPCSWVGGKLPKQGAQGSAQRGQEQSCVQAETHDLNSALWGRVALSPLRAGVWNAIVLLALLQFCNTSAGLAKSSVPCMTAEHG